MPKKNNHTRVAPENGKNTAGRKAGRQVICDSQRTTKDPSILGNSFLTLTLVPKPGIEVFCIREGFNGTAYDVSSIYNDLWTCYQNARTIFGMEKLKINPSSYLELPHALGYILDNFREILDPKFDFNIGKHSSTGFHFTIFQACEWEYGWSMFSVKSALQKLHKESKPLHDLFLSFLYTLRWNAGVGLWEDGYIGGWLEELDDRLAELRKEMDEEEYMEYKMDLFEHRTGDGKNYYKKILNAPKLTPIEILKRVKYFRKTGPITTLIQLGAEVMLQSYNLSDYSYINSMNEEEGDFFLPIDEQCCVLWKSSGYVFSEISDYLDAMANEGLQEPVCFREIRKNTKSLDLEEFDRMAKWPIELLDFLDRAQDLINEYLQ